MMIINSLVYISCCVANINQLSKAIKWSSQFTHPKALASEHNT